MTQADTTAQVFDQAIGIERRAAAFYARLAGRFLSDPAITAFWHRLYSEELEHASILTAVVDQLSSRDLLAPPDPALARRVDDAGHLLATIEASPVATLEDAYQLAHDLEFSEVNAVFQVLALSSVPPEDQRRFVLEQIEGHQGRLIAFGRTYDRRRRQRISIDDTPPGG